jgi:hypothetical protein
MNGLDVRERNSYGICFPGINVGMSNSVGHGSPTCCLKLRRLPRRRIIMAAPMLPVLEIGGDRAWKSVKRIS